QVGIDRTDLAIGAGRIHTITSCRAGWTAHKMITLVSRENELSVAGIDTIGSQPSEELAEGIIVRLECRNITGLAGAKGWSRGMHIVCVRDIGVGDGNAMFLHISYVGKRDGCLHAIKAREADVSLRILNNIAVQIRHWAIRANLGRD